MFLHYVLNLNKEEMLSQFFWIQWKSPVSSDWTETVKEDMDVLKIGRTIYEIKKMKKHVFAKIVKESFK